MVSRRTRDGYPVTTEVRIGGQTVLVRGRRKNEQFAVPKGRSFGIDHFGLSVPDLESALETLRTRGIKAETSFNNGFTVPTPASPSCVDLTSCGSRSHSSNDRQKGPTRELRAV